MQSNERREAQRAGDLATWVLPNAEIRWKAEVIGVHVDGSRTWNQHVSLSP